MRVRRIPLPAEPVAEKKEDKEEKPKPLQATKNEGDSVPANLKEFLEKFGFKDTHTHQEYGWRSAWILPTPLGIAMEKGYVEIVKEFLVNEEFLGYLQKNPDEVGRLTRALIRISNKCRPLVMEAITKITHTQEEHLDTLIEYFSAALSELHNIRSYYSEYLQAYLEYCYNNFLEYIPDVFNHTFTKNRYKYNEAVIPKFPIQAAFDEIDPFLLQLFLNYKAQPDAGMIATILRSEGALPEPKKNSKMNHLYLWLEHDFDTNLPVLVEAVKQAQIDPKHWINTFYELPKEHFDKFATAFNISNDYHQQAQILAMAKPHKITDKLFGHIHNDRALKGTIYEGMYPWETLGYLKKTIGEIQRDPKTPAHYAKSLAALQKKITGCYEIAEQLHLFSTEKSIKEGRYSEKVESMTDLILDQLKENNEALIPGGWVNESSSGHTMLYEIKDSKIPGKKVLLIYNTGAGLHNHFLQVENKKMYYSTVKAYEFEVDDFAHNRNRLAAIIRPLMAFNMRAMYKKLTEGLSGKKLYAEIDKITALQGLQEIDPKPYCKEWSKGQNSGTCSWRAPYTFLKNFEYTDGMTYKDLRYEIRVRSLKEMLALYQQNQSGSTQRQLNYGLQNFALLLAQTQDDTSDKAKARRAQGLQLIEEIKVGMQTVMPNPTPATLTAKKILDVKDKLEFVITNKNPGRLRELPANETKIEESIYHAPEHATLDIADPIKSFEQTLEFCEKYLASGQYSLVSNCIEKLYLSFPLDLHNKPDVLSMSYDDAAYHKYAISMAEAICKLQLMYSHAISKQGKHAFSDRTNILQCGAAIADYALHDFFVKHPLLAAPWLGRYNLQTQSDDVGNLSCSATINAKAQEVKKYFKEKTALAKIAIAAKAAADNISYSQPGMQDPLEEAYLDIVSTATSTQEFDEMVRNDRSFVHDWIKPQTEFNGIIVPGNRSEPPRKLVNAKYFYQNIHKVKDNYPECMENLKIFLLYEKLTEYLHDIHHEVVTEEPPINKNFDIIVEKGFGYGAQAILVESHKWALKLAPSKKDYKKAHNSSIKEIEPVIASEEYKIDGMRFESNTIQISNLKVSVDEKLALQRQLKLIRMRPKTEINLTVDLMTKEFFRLKNPDMQNFCYKNLFTVELLQNQIIATPAISSSLLDVIERGLKQYVTGSKVKDESLYFLKLACSLQKVMLDLVKEELMPPSPLVMQNLVRLEKIHKKLDKLIVSNTKKTTAKINEKLEKMHTYRLMMITNEVKFNNIATPETLSNYISSLCFRKKYATQKTADPFIMHNIQQDMFRCEDLLVKYINKQNLNEFFQSVIKPLQMNLPDPVETTWENNHPIYTLRSKDTKAEVFNLNSRTGLIEQQGRSLVAIPSEIYTSQPFQTFFKNHPPLGAYYNSAYGTYEFEHENREYIYKQNTFLKQKINNEWYSLQGDNLHISVAKDKQEYSFPISEYGNDRWCVDGGENELVIQRDTHKALYSITPQTSAKGIRYTIRIADENGNLTNSLLTPQAKKSFTGEHEWIQRFESNKYTEVSIDPKTQLHTVKFPRYDLEFKEKITGSTTEWIYTKDPRYKIIPGQTHAISQINSYLHLTAEPENTLDDIILMPKQQFYKGSIPNAEYIGLKFDNSNYLRIAKLEIEQKDFNPQNFQITDSEEIVTYGYSKAKGLILHQPQDNLYLSYLSLVKRDAPAALLQLQKFYQSNAAIGIDELNWLQRILEEIPARTSKYTIDTNNFQLNAPEILAVRAFAGFILAKASLNKQLPDLELEKIRLQDKPETKNKEINLAQLEFLSNFYKSLSDRIAATYHAYLSKIPKIAANLQLTSRQEHVILEKLKQAHGQLHDIALNHRWSELNFEFLCQEAEDLANLQNTPAFTQSKQERLQAVNTQISSYLEIDATRMMIDEEEVTVLPTHDFIRLPPHLKELLTTPSEPASIHCYGLTDRDYITNFQHFIDTVYEGDSAALAILKDESNLHIRMIAHKINNKNNLSFTDNLRILLSYVIHSPDVFSGKSFAPETLAQHLITIKALQKDKDLVVVLAKTTVVKHKLQVPIPTSGKVKRLPKQKQVYQLEADPELQLLRADIATEIAKHNDTNLSEETKLELATNTYLTLEKSKELLGYFTQKMLADTQKLANLERGILEWANRPPKDAAEKAHWELTGHSRQRIPLSMKDVLHLYLKQDQGLFEQHTNLSAAELPEFNQNVLHFLVTATDHQQNEKIFAKLNQIVLNPNVLHDAKNKTDAGKLLLQERAENLMHEPRMLLFEYFDNKRIYTKQYEFMRELLDTSNNPEGSFENLVQQLIMGGGKSKVLLPILCLAKATGMNISAVIVPEALYNIYVADLSGKTQEIFGKKPFSFTFNEQVECDDAYVDNLYRSLINVMVDREYLITTKQSVQSLQLHFAKLLNSNKPEDKHKIEVLNQIMKLFKYQTDAIADEVHAALDTRQELIYTLGEGERISMPILEFVLDMYEAFRYIPLPHSSEFNLNDVVEEKVRITGDQFEALTPVIARTMIQNTHSPLYKICQGFDKDQQEQLIQYLLEKSKPDFIQQLPEQNRDFLAIAKQQINQVLGLTLTRNLNEHFGLPKVEGNPPILPVPYVASNTPSTSEFGNYIEIINYTRQLYRDKIPEFIVKNFIDLHVRAMQAELEVNNQKDPYSERFFELTGWKLADHDYTDPDVFKEFHADVANKKAFKKYCLLNYIMSEIVRNTVTIVNNSQNFASLVATFQGTTGTPWNLTTYPLFMKLFKKFHEDIDAQVIANLHKAPLPPLLLTNTSASALNMIPQLIANSADSKSMHAWIDIGAYFRGIPNEVIANTFVSTFDNMQTMQHLKYVLCFNSKDQLLAYPTKASGLPATPILLENPDALSIQTKLNCTPSDYYTYYDQRHITGTDITQAPAAKALVPIGLKTLLHDLLQGVMRMRGLGSGQQIQFVIDKELQDAYPDKKWDVSDIVAFCTKNSEKRLGDDNFKAAMQKMHNVIWEDCYCRILEADSPEKRTQLFGDFQKVFITINNKSPYDQYGDIATLTRTADILAKYKISLMNIWQEAVQNTTPVNKEIISTKLDEVIVDAVKHCPEFIEHNQNDETMDTQVNIETALELQNQNLLEAQKEAEMELTSHKNRYHVQRRDFKLIDNTALAQETEITFKKLMIETYPYTNMDKVKPLVQTLEEALVNDNIVRDWQFSPNISVTANFITTSDDQLHMLDVVQKDPVLMLVVHDSVTDEVKFLIVTAEDAEKFHDSAFSPNQGNKTFWIETVHGVPYWQTKPELLPKSYDQGLQQIAFLAGDTDILNATYTPDSWLADKGQEKLDFMQHYLLPQHPDKLNVLDRLKKAMNTTSLSAQAVYPREIAKDESSEEKEALHNTEPIPAFFIKRRPSIKALPQTKMIGPKNSSHSEASQVKADINRMVDEFIELNLELAQSDPPLPTPIERLVEKINNVCTDFKELRDESYQSYYKKYFITIDKLLFFTDIASKLKDKSPKLNEFINKKFLPHFSSVLKDEKIDMRTVSNQIKAAYNINTARIHSDDKRQRSMPLKFIYESNSQIYADLLQFEGVAQAKITELYERLRKLSYDKESDKMTNYRDKISVLDHTLEAARAYINGSSLLPHVTKIIEEQMVQAQKITHVGWRHAIMGSNSDTADLLKGLQSSLLQSTQAESKHNRR